MSNKSTANDRYGKLSLETSDERELHAPLGAVDESHQHIPKLEYFCDGGGI